MLVLVFHGAVHPKLKFWGKSMEVQPKGVVTIKLPFEVSIVLVLNTGVCASVSVPWCCPSKAHNLGQEHRGAAQGCCHHQTSKVSIVLVLVLNAGVCVSVCMKYYFEFHSAVHPKLKFWGKRVLSPSNFQSEYCASVSVIKIQVSVLVLVFHSAVHPKLKFWGKSMEVQPKGVVTIKLPK